MQSLVNQYSLSDEPGRKEFLDALFNYLEREGVCVHCTCLCVHVLITWSCTGTLAVGGTVSTFVSSYPKSHIVRSA